MRTHPPPLQDLVEAFSDEDHGPPVVARVTLEHVHRHAEAARVFQYLAVLAHRPTNLDDLLATVRGLNEEEELCAYRVAEGVALTHASDGWWVLFTD